MIRGLGGDRGASLIEQMVALMLGAIMITSLYGYFRNELYASLVLDSKTAALEDARGALDIIIRDLKNAGSWGTGSAPTETGSGDDPNNDSDDVCNRVYAANAGLVHIQMDLNGNSTCADTDPRENIRYELTGPTATCPGTNIIRRNGDCLVANVVPFSPGRIFNFYDSDGLDLGATPVRDAIKRIKVAFAVQVKNPDPRVGGTLNVPLSSSIELRN